jgi:cleavage and polyadenylation specificity factor subunit 2
MGRIAVAEDVEGVRDERDVGDDTRKKDPNLDGFPDVDMMSEGPNQNTAKSKGIYVATTQEVHDAFDSVNTLRYSQPTHLQGSPCLPSA